MRRDLKRANLSKCGHFELNKVFTLNALLVCSGGGGISCLSGVIKGICVEG